jgi:cytosine permease
MGSMTRALARLVEQGPFKRVVAQDQRGWFFLATIKVGVMICVPLFALGGQLGTHMRLAELVPAIVVGAVVTAILASLTGLVGMHARVPTAVLVRTTFGVQGGKVVAAVLIVTLFGWFGVQTEVLVSSLNGLLKATFGFTLNRLALTVVCGALMSSTAIVGFRALGKVAYVAVPLMMAVIAVPVWIALHTHDWLPMVQSQVVQSPLTFGTVVSIVTGGNMVAVAITPDITRFMRSPRDTLIGVTVGYAIVLPILLVLAALLAMIYANGDLVAIMILTGVGGPALLVIALATWTANDKNLYETSLSLGTLMPRVARWKLAVFAATVGTALAAANIFGHLIPLLVFMGVTIAPVAGVYVVDYAVGPARYQGGDDPPLRKLPFVAWIIGILSGMATLPADGGGFGLFALTSAPTLDALIGAAVAQFVLRRWQPARVAVAE